MRPSLLSAGVVGLLVVLQATHNDATLPGLDQLALTLGTSPNNFVFPFSQLAPYLGAGVLAKGAGVLAGLTLGRALNNRRGGRGRGRRRGRREVGGEETEESEARAVVNMLVDMEPEHCFKMVFCAATTGQYRNPRLDGMLQYLSDEDVRSSLDTKSAQFVEAAKIGVSFRDVAKCEARYKCSVNLESIKPFL